MKTIFIAGHNGMVGSAVLKKLIAEGRYRILTRSRSELDLLDQSAVKEFFLSNSIDQVYLCAAKVGGIIANSQEPATFLYENLLIQANLLEFSRLSNVERVLVLGSSCIYPKFSDQPIREELLLTGELEPTNESYALAKIVGLKLCESFRSQFEVDYRALMPCNLYGSGDNFDEKSGHVIPALISKFHNAKRNGLKVVELMGTGTALREFMDARDLADAAVITMNLDRETFESVKPPRRAYLNVGTGEEVTILELAELIAGVVGFTGKIVFNGNGPDGTPRKVLDSSRLRQTGWVPSILIKKGIKDAYLWYQQNVSNRPKSPQ